MIVATVSLTQAGEQLSSLVADVAGTEDRVAITQDGVPTVVILAVEALAALQETLDILSEPGVVKSLADEDATAQEVDPAELWRARPAPPS